ncbi:MAG: YdcH family protein [Gammaproteobacteria bacterium]
MHEANPEIVESLLTRDDEFKQLYQRHQALDKEVDKAGEGRIAMGDLNLEDLKKERLWVKDQIYAKIQQHESAAPG